MKFIDITIIFSIIVFVFSAVGSVTYVLDSTKKTDLSVHASTVQVTMSMTIEESYIEHQYAQTNEKFFNIAK